MISSASAFPSLLTSSSINSGVTQKTYQISRAWFPGANQRMNHQPISVIPLVLFWQLDVQPSAFAGPRDISITNHQMSAQHETRVGIFIWKTAASKIIVWIIKKNDPCFPSSFEKDSTTHAIADVPSTLSAACTLGDTQPITSPISNYFPNE